MTPSHRRINDLLADHAIMGLSETEEMDLRDLLDEHTASTVEDLDRIAAALDLSLSLAAGLNPPPPSLHASIERTAVRWLAESKGLRIVNDSTEVHDPAVKRIAPSRDVLQLFPWLLAAACAIAAVIAWTSHDSRHDPAELYRTIAAQAGAATYKFTDADGNPVGEIVWNGRTQQGVMRFDRLTANDPSEVQYQLWIFDQARAAHSKYTAVDGGVFDIASDAEEVFVPVNAKLRVFNPELFAVTTEPPGGVIKHIDTERHRIVTTALGP